MLVNRVMHFEIGADKPERVAEFYTKIFGWKIKKWEEGNEPYWLVMTGDNDKPGINGGIFKRPGPVNADIVNTIAVPSVDKYVKKIEANGGKILMPKMEVMGAGWLVYAQDTEGNPFGIMQSTMPME